MSRSYHASPTLGVKQQKKKSQISPNTGCAGRCCGTTGRGSGLQIAHPYMGVLGIKAVHMAVLIIGNDNQHYRNLYLVQAGPVCSSGLAVNVANLPPYVGSHDLVNEVKDVE